MTNQVVNSAKKHFLTGLDTLSHVLDVSIDALKSEGDAILDYRLIGDMLPFGTQIVFTCNQPRNFSRWCEGLTMENLPPEVESLDQVVQIISDTRDELVKAEASDSKLQEAYRVDLVDPQYLELCGFDYIDEFLIPNFYFHLVTAYNIMRMKGVPLGKANYVPHLVAKIKQ
jgi:hypothetical protein